MVKFMNPLSLFGAAVLGGGLLAGAARADVVLTPGAGATPLGAAETLPAGATLLASNTRVSVGGSATPGFLTEAVYNDPTANGGAGGLDFVFQVTNSPASTVPIVSFNTLNYGTTPIYNTSAGVFSPAPGGAGFTTGTVSPTTGERGPSGATVIFDGFSLAPGQTSTTFFVRTNATAYNTLGQATISGAVTPTSNPGTDVFLNTFEPAGPITTAGVPEPSTFVMAATAGVAGLGFGWRRRRAQV